MNHIKKEIIATLSFFGTCKKSLSFDELFENLYKFNDYENEVTSSVLAKELSELIKSGEIDYMETHTGPRFKMKDAITYDTNDYSEQLKDKATRFRWLFSSTPFINLTAVCNTVAFKAAKKGSDIDLFIVTKKNRMFTARAIITLLTHITFQRRHNNKVSERFCLSFFADESAMNISKLAIQDDIYLTYWYKNLEVIYARNEESITSFIDENKYFASKHLYHPSFNIQDIKYGQNLFGKILTWILNGRIGDIIESKLKSWQLNRASEKAQSLKNTSGTIINEHMLKFHNEDRREEIKIHWERSHTSIKSELKSREAKRHIQKFESVSFR